MMHDVVFPGQYFDAETNLHYNYFRDYDPSTGRYIESDPIGLDAGLNTYSYALQNSIRYIDPDGQSPQAIGIGIGIIGIGVAIIGTNTSSDVNGRTTESSCGEPCLFIHASSRPLVDGTLPTDVTQYTDSELTCWYACPTKGLVPRVEILKYRMLPLLDRLRCIIDFGPIIFE